MRGIIVACILLALATIPVVAGEEERSEEVIECRAGFCVAVLEEGCVAGTDAFGNQWYYYVCSGPGNGVCVQYQADAAGRQYFICGRASTACTVLVETTVFNDDGDYQCLSG